MKVEDLQEKDLDDIVEWFDVSIFRFFKDPIDVNQLRILLPLIENGRPIRIAKKVIGKNSTKIFGFVSSTVDWDNDMMHIRTFCIRPDYRRKGIGLFLMKEIINICFDDLKLHRAQLFVDEWNEAGVKFYEKLMFHRDGLMREAVKINNQYRSWCCMSLLAEEWRRIETYKHAIRLEKFMTTLKLGFLASHEGTNMQAIIDACNDGRLKAKPCVVISNNSDSGAIQRAKKEDIPFYHLSGKTHLEFEELDKAILDALKTNSVNLVILAGYMKKIGPKTLAGYEGRILNIHPALLPKYGGKGMYGRSVHETVLASGDKITGVTIHIVDAVYDHGPIIAQCQIPILEEDTVETLSKRVLKREHEFFVETLQRISTGKIELSQ